jgi:hypothetical protein
MSKHEVRHFWSCDNCGHEIEMVVNLRIDAASGLNKRLEPSVAHKHSLRIGSVRSRLPEDWLTGEGTHLPPLLRHNGRI